MESTIVITLTILFSIGTILYFYLTGSKILITNRKRRLRRGEKKMRSIIGRKGPSSRSRHSNRIDED